MKEIKNQRGFSTLEIILIVGIIGILSSVGVPKMAQVVNKVSLDYEMKILYSELNLARSVGKSSTFDPTFFYDNFKLDGTIEIWIFGTNYRNSSSRNRYEIKRPSRSASKVFYQHYLTNGIDIEFNQGTEVLKISFDNPSRYSSGSRTLELTSKFKNKSKIIFDTVGRWRGTYEK